MRSEWREKSLGELIDIKHGFAFKGEFICDKASGNILLTPGNFAVGGGFKGEKLKFYNGPVPENFVLNQGDLIITMTDLSKNADTLGYPAIVPLSHKGHRFLHNQRLGKVIVNDSDAVDCGYLYYLMCGQNYRHEVLASATGTTVKHTAPERIKRFRFNLPPLVEQRWIAHILGTLDDKIELNRQMNETLEAIARAIFKSWFVDFDPVRAKMEGRMPAGMDAATATLFPSAFQDSPLGKIPEGWKVGTLGGIAENVRQSVKASEIDSDEFYIGLEHMPRQSITLSEWQTADGLGSNKYRFSKGEILFGKLRPYFHKVGVAPLEGVCSTDILVIRPIDSEWFGIVLGLVSSDEFIAYTNAYSAGTRMPRTNWKDMSRYEIVLPQVEVSQKYTEFIRPFIERIIENIHQSHTLSQIRDALLPKLLSGEIRVDDVDERLEVKDGRIA